MVQLGYSPNRDALLDVARALGPMLPDVVFVGGQVAELLITAPGATRVRPTDDVDIVVSAATKVEYRKVEEQLTELGLTVDPEGPICRWKTRSGTKVDVMPVDESVLGFGSRWYLAAISQAVPYQLSNDLSILIPPAPVFLATKWDAFHSRGGGDPLGSHDMEDIISVVAGRPELVAEIVSSDAEIRDWLSQRTKEFLETELADYAIQGALPDTATVPELLRSVRSRFESLI
jgi:hypothetical protein